MNKKLHEKLLYGKEKYTVGLIFAFGTLVGYFFNMRKLNISDASSVSLLAAFALIAMQIA